MWHVVVGGERREERGGGVLCCLPLSVHSYLVCECAKKSSERNGIIVYIRIEIYIDSIRYSLILGMLCMFIYICSMIVCCTCSIHYTDLASSSKWVD